MQAAPQRRRKSWEPAYSRQSSAATGCGEDADRNRKRAAFSQRRPTRRIHQLDEAAELAPDDDEVRDAAGQHHNGDGRQGMRFIDQHVI